MTINNETSFASLFVNAWNIYRKILDCNYMFHAEIGLICNQALQEHFKAKSIRVLDLGCGDASQIRSLLSGLNIDYYCGCDIAHTPLLLAKQTLSNFAKKMEFKCVDMLNCTQQMQSEFDLVISSFAIHHLTQIDKQSLFQEISRILAPSGMFLMIDVLKQDHQSLASYHSDYLSHARINWRSLEQNELDYIEHHVTAHDQPESLIYYREIALQGGFRELRHLSQHTWHNALALYN